MPARGEVSAEKKDVEQLIREGKTVRIFPEGYSMYPMFVPGRDEAVIGRADVGKLRRGDVALYRRASGKLVLHRLYRRDGDAFYMLGDNQTKIEGPLSGEQMKGVLLSFVRKGRQISVKNPLYRMMAMAWLFLFPIRGILQKTGAAVMGRRRRLRGKRKER